MIQHHVYLLLTLSNYQRTNKFNKLIQHHCYYDLRNFNFTNRVITIWNRLFNHVVSDDTVNTSKNRLDNYWSNQDVLHDYKADLGLHATGNRSTVMYRVVSLYIT